MNRPLHEAIDVDVPASTAYRQWSRLEDFPDVFPNVLEVRRTSTYSSLWTVRFGNQVRKWKAAIVEQIPGKRIAWHSVEGLRNWGCVTFHHLAPRRCRVMLQLQVDSPGVLENLFHVTGLLRERVRKNLLRFKSTVETADARSQNSMLPERRNGSRLASRTSSPFVHRQTSLRGRITTSSQ